MPRPIIPNQEDVFCWKPSNNGYFNSSSAYHLAFGLTSTKLPTSCWKWLWKLNTIPRVIYFLWLACHNRLPTKLCLLRRNITADDLCPLCKSKSESLIHNLRDCPLVQPIWCNMGSVLPQDFFLVSNVKAWIKTWSTSTLDTSFHPSIHWKDVFPLLCWSIWSARNKVAMEGALFIPSRVLKRVKSLAIEFFFSLSTKGDKLAKSDTLIGWQHPPRDFVKLNTDGSVLGNPGLTSSGGVLRDSNENWVRGFSH